MYDLQRVLASFLNLSVKLSTKVTFNRLSALGVDLLADLGSP